MIILFIYLFVLGLILGSFYNVVGLRVPVKKSIVWPRSSCPRCGRVLTPFELIPFLSYLFQKGKCRGCSAPVSPLYPTMELLTGVLFAGSPLLVGWSEELIIAFALNSLLVIITVTDLSYMVIPDRILLFFAVVFLILHLFFPTITWWDAISGAAVGFSSLLFIAIISRGGMGGGDIKLFAVIGLAIGVKSVLLSLFFATLYGAIVGILFIFIGVFEKGKPVPFGPFIALGTLTAFFFGDGILSWYFTLFY